MVFPEEFPRITKDLSNEKILFYRFKKELGREFTVYYSVKLTTPDVPMREIDFLVVSPRLILCIEVKNGKWRYKSGRWEFYNRRSKSWEQQRNKPYNGPVDQIRSARRILIDFLYHHNSFHHPVDSQYIQSCIFFLKNESADFPISDKEKEYFIGKSRLKSSRITMRDILVSLQNPDLPPIDHQTITNLHNIIRLNLNYATDIYSKKKSQSLKLLSLTKDQFEILRRGSEIPHAIILGVPGSGKTIVATETAFRLEALHTRTLFVTGCKTTADTLGNLVRWFSVVFIPYNQISEIEDEYDYVIMDSSEVYLSEKFLSQSKNLIKNGWERGKWLVLGDWHYSLKKKNFREALEILRKYSPLELVWKQNIRTPGKVYEQACLLGRKDYNPGKLPDITGIQYSSYSSEEEFFLKLEWSIQYGIRDLGIDRSEIVILSLDPELTQRILERNYAISRSHPIVRYEETHTTGLSNDPENTSCVSISNLEDFQGREAAYTIVVGIYDFNDESRFDDYYHALTKCTAACALLYPESRKDQLAEILGHKSEKAT